MNTSTVSRCVSLQCHCGAVHRLDIGTPAPDPRGALLALADGPLGMKPGTLTRWAREGRLRAFTVERGRLVCWESDLRDAIEAEPVTPAPVASSARAVADDDEQLAALSAMGGAS